MTSQFNPDIDYAKTGDCSHSQPFYALRNNCTVKVSKKLGRQILLFDITVVRLGTVRNLQLKHIGLGIHEVRLLPVETSESGEPRVGSNMLVTEFFE
jgi:hypothetical protein